MYFWELMLLYFVYWWLSLKDIFMISNKVSNFIMENNNKDKMTNNKQHYYQIDKDKKNI